ncbi:MAG TPA: ADP-ribosylglycohydrolase family protein, partial [Micromonosporaceae bacterium]|nr:ADP-ribosylglycohydrolase family protein [Micromonosporaceae bacterium]
PTPELLEPLLRKRFVDWSISPENNRAPGDTCMRACADLAAGLPWTEASVVRSKGCGANMRVTPVGLAPGFDLETLAGTAQLQAALTHGHPTALAASELTAFAVWSLRHGEDLAELPPLLRERARSQRTVYRDEWLGDLWRHAGDDDPAGYAARGWDESAAALDRLAAALREPDDGRDASRVTGEGWIAEEALATALYVYLISPDEPVAVLGRGAASSGDSDSVASLTGAFLGAAYGEAAWPAAWAERIEYANQLAALGAAWDQAPS